MTEIYRGVRSVLEGVLGFWPNGNSKVSAHRSMPYADLARSIDEGVASILMENSSSENFQELDHEHVNVSQYVEALIFARRRYLQAQQKGMCINLIREKSAYTRVGRLPSMACLLNPENMPADLAQDLPYDLQGNNDLQNSFRRIVTITGEFKGHFECRRNVVGVLREEESLGMVRTHKYKPLDVIKYEDNTFLIPSVNMLYPEERMSKRIHIVLE